MTPVVVLCQGTTQLMGGISSRTVLAAENSLLSRFKNLLVPHAANASENNDYSSQPQSQAESVQSLPLPSCLTGSYSLVVAVFFRSVHVHGNREGTNLPLLLDNLGLCSEARR